MDQKEHMHRCEVRTWMRMRTTRDVVWLRKVLMDIAKKRGEQAAQRLRDDIADQWRKGNRGEFDDWR